jgi:hypothetical protein
MCFHKIWKPVETHGVGFHGFPRVSDATIAMGFHIDIHGFPWVSNDIHGMETRGGITRERI